MNFFEKTRRFVKEATPPVSRAMILFMAIFALTLSSCVSVSISAAEDPAVAATAMHYKNVADIQSLATQMAPFYDWSEFEPCAESAVRVEATVPGSGNLINRKLVMKIGSGGQLIDQEVIQLVVSGHQVTPDLTQMSGQQIIVAPPSGAGGEPGQYMVLSANAIVDLPGTGDDVVSLIAVGDPGKLSGTIPVGDRIDSGMDLGVGTEIFVASIPSGAGVSSLSPTRSTIESNYDGMIFAAPQNNSKSVPSIQGSSGSAGCVGGQVVGTVVRADMENVVLTALGPNTAALVLEQFWATLAALESSHAYTIQ